MPSEQRGGFTTAFSASLRSETTWWAAAGTPRNNLVEAGHTHRALGPILVEAISDALDALSRRFLKDVPQREPTPA